MRMVLDAGLCETCLHMRLVRSAKGSVFRQCQLSFEDARFPKYPRLPVLECSGWMPSQGVEEPQKTYRTLDGAN
jgi:hypothetical protein